LFIELENTFWGGGMSISPSNQFLYISSTLEVYQFDLWSDDIEASIDTVAIYDGFESPLPTSFFISQLGPDGRIYINTTTTLVVWAEPHLKDEAEFILIRLQLLMYSMLLTTLTKKESIVNLSSTEYSCQQEIY
jgi:hypothetical protein